MSDSSLPDRVVDAASAVRTTAYSPLYQQIKLLLLNSLDQGEWKPGEAIPSEVELAARFQVSQGTVRKAIDELAAENLLIRRQGKGTFVATHSEAKIRYRFLRLAPDTGAPGPSSSKILECSRIRCPSDVAVLLQMRSGDTVINLKRLLSFNNQPTILDELWLPGAVFKGLNAETIKRNKGPLYAHFESEYGVSMVRADEKIKAIGASSYQANLLKVDVATPLLFVERVSFTYGDRPMEVRRGLYVTQYYHYKNSLN